MKRTIIKIDESLCNGCGLCVKGCHEGALQLIDGKAVLISELYCDGLGACLGECPQQAILLEEREAEAYDERKVMESMLLKGEKIVVAHLKHLATHRQHDYIRQALEVLRENNIPEPDFGIEIPEIELQNSFANSFMITVPEEGCPGNRNFSFTPQSSKGCNETSHVQSSNSPSTSFVQGGIPLSQLSELQQWPIQLHLISPIAPWLKEADLLVAADCTAYAVGDFHSNWLRDKRLAIACPKLDDSHEIYLERLVSIIDKGGINTMTVMIMEVPCCSGLLRLCQEARQKACRNIPLKVVKISLQGAILQKEWL